MYADTHNAQKVNGRKEDVTTQNFLRSPCTAEMQGVRVSDGGMHCNAGGRTVYGVCFLLRTKTQHLS